MLELLWFALVASWAILALLAFAPAALSRTLDGLEIASSGLLALVVAFALAVVVGGPAGGRAPAPSARSLPPLASAPTGPTAAAAVAPIERPR